jgi:hypothetical protein
MTNEIKMNNIEQLKQFVLQSRELSEPLNYFFDLTDADAFSKIKSHQPVKKINQHAELMAVVQVVQQEANNRLGKAIKQLTPVFFEIPEHHFYHGACLSTDLFIPLTVIYFSDVKTGIFATTGAQTDMMRFTLMKASDLKERH